MSFPRPDKEHIPGLIIGISGKARSGKDTVAQILRNNGLNEANLTTIVHFADVLKYTLARLCSTRDCMISHNDFTTTEGKQKTIPWLDNMTHRELLQRFGTAIREEVHPDFWVKVCIHHLEFIQPNYLKKYDLIVPDVRFPNEKKAIEDLGGIVIRVERPGIDSGNHISETALDDAEFCHTIQNDGTLEELETKVKEFLNDYINNSRSSI